jgi:N-acyl-D-amino-acid deacylase
MHDLVIRNGTVIDGSGEPRFEGDIAVDGKTIVAVGKVSGKGRQEIDATGKLVTPGWVDVHTHYDGQATWDPIMAPSSWHGVTTVVMGNCGVGFAPVRPGGEQFLIELMEGVEDIPGSALAEGIQWDWESFPEYLDALEKLPRTLDVGAQVPHGAIRAYVMGERCNGDNDPTPDELKQMVALVRDGVQAGALGFSTSRTLLHKDVHGVHVPGTFAGSDEMLQLGLAMKGLDHGMFEMVSDNLGDDDEWAWVKSFAEQTGRPVTLIATTPAAYVGNKMYNMVEEARQCGMNIMPQMASRPTGILHGLQSSFHLFMNRPTFVKEIAGLSLAETVEAMSRPEVRQRILQEAPASTSAMFDPDRLLSMVFPLGEMPNYEPDFEGSVAGIAKANGVSSQEVMYDLLIGNGGKELFYQPLGGYTDYSLDRQRAMMQHPNVLMGLSDGGAHCGVIADAGMPTFTMLHWGRDRKKGEKLPLEFIVRSMTARTASAYGLNDRGLLAAGKLADINVIDFDRLRLFRPEATFDLPTGGRRLVQRVEGYDTTIKSGEVTFVKGEPTGARPGGLVRG